MLIQPYIRCGLSAQNDEVVAGLVPAIHALFVTTTEDVDARDERGHDS
jgi:hypothetical protein